jgi:hypothetical protein
MANPFVSATLAVDAGRAKTKRRMPPPLANALTTHSFRPIQALPSPGQARGKGTNLSDANGSAKVPPKGKASFGVSEFPAFTRWANLCRASGATFKPKEQQQQVPASAGRPRRTYSATSWPIPQPRRLISRARLAVDPGALSPTWAAPSSASVPS